MLFTEGFGHVLRDGWLSSHPMNIKYSLLDLVMFKTVAYICILCFVTNFLE